MKNAQWRFRRMGKAEINQEPIEREFFDEEPINTRLVREAIQNSLDARCDANTPVKVRFSLRGIHKPLPAYYANKYIKGLARHLRTQSDMDVHALFADDANLSQGGLPFIVIEDAGTVGLEGKFEQYDDSETESASNNHFYWFFRNVGRSGKGDSENGSWGLGKWVFPDASCISSYIAVTRRRSDNAALLMGQSVLKKHDVNRRRHAPYGYFGIFDDEEFALPLDSFVPEQKAFIDECITDFGLWRRDKDESGLSIIIPFPRIDGEDERLETPKILAAIIHNYFYAIINRSLEVTLDEGDGSPPIEITADTIDSVLERADLEDSGERSVEGYQHLFEMCRQKMALSDGDYIDILVADIDRMNDEGYTGIKRLRRRYNAHELLPFRVTTDVQRKNGAREETKFNLYIQKDDALRDGHDYYVRGTLSISEMNFIGQTSARTLLTVHEREPLAAMLRDSEPPAHTSWRTSVHRVTDRWVAAPRRITAVRNASRRLLQALRTPTESIQKDAFADIFFYVEPNSRVASRGQRTGTAATAGRRAVDINGNPMKFEISNTHSGTGFRIRIPTDSENPPEYALLQVAYQTPRGNPIKSYTPNDFRLRDLNITHKGCEVMMANAEIGTAEKATFGKLLRGIFAPPSEAASSAVKDTAATFDAKMQDNEMRLYISDPRDFDLSVQGFDSNRDVYVKLDELSGDMELGGADNDTQV